MPALRALQKKYEDQGLYILAVSPEDDDVVEKAIKRDKIDYAVAVDPQGVTGKRWPNCNASLGYLIGPDGKVVWGGHIQRLGEDTIESLLRTVTPGKPKLAKSSGSKATSATATASVKTTTRPKRDKYPHTLKLKDGAEIKGRLITKTATKVFFKGEDGKMKTYAASDVVEVLK